MKRAERPKLVDLDDKPGHLIRRAHQLQAVIFEAEAGQFRVTAPQHVIMTALFRNPGVDQATLAGLVALDKVTTGHIVARLMARGLVRRSASEVDRRAHVVQLSPAGRRLLLGMQGAVQRSQARLLSPLSAAEKRQFFTVLRRIVGMTPPFKRKSA